MNGIRLCIYIVLDIAMAGTAGSVCTEKKDWRL